MLTAERSAEDLQAVIFAVDPAGTIQANVARPRRSLQVSGTINHQRGPKNTISLRVTHEGQKSRNEGIGGTSLPEVASDDQSHEEQIIYGHRTIVTRRLISDLRLLVGQDRQTTASLNPGRRIVVLDAFTGGGAQNDRVQTEHNFTFTHTLTLALPRHLIKGG